MLKHSTKKPALVEVTKSLLLLAVSTAIIHPSTAFVPMALVTRSSLYTGQHEDERTFFGHSSSLKAYDPYRSGGDGDKQNDDSMGRIKARTDLRNFLTQRSLQSFVYLLNQCRDGHTVKWVEDTLEFPKLDSYHGTGAFDMERFPSWDSLFLDLVDRPKESVVVEIQKQIHRRPHRGLSGHNNYLEALGSSNKTPRPPSLPSYRGPPGRKSGSSGGLSGRDSYLEALSAPSSSPKKEETSSKKEKGKVKSKADAPQNPPTPPTTMKRDKTKLPSNPFLKAKTIVEYELDIDPASLVTRIISVREQLSKEWQGDLQILINTNEQIVTKLASPEQDSKIQQRHQDEDEDEDSDDEEDDEDYDSESEYGDLDEDEDDVDLTKPYSAQEEKGQHKGVVAFDRNAMFMMTNCMASQDRDSSPFRRSNFDLLVLLCTQESLHRVLQAYSRMDDQQESLQWLQDFYNARVKKYFDGHQSGYGRADQFMEELLLSPPVVQKSGKDSIRIIDPMAMAEDIIRERSEVAQEWQAIVASIPDEHIGLQRLLLTRRMMEVTLQNLEHSVMKAESGLSEAKFFE